MDVFSLPSALPGKWKPCPWGAEIMRKLTTRSRTIPIPISKNPTSSTNSHSPAKSKSPADSSPGSTPIIWSVYLILSTNPPIKTYVGVTTDFTRRLRQHNGELKGGAKASSAGRPWVCACIIHGFRDRSQACSFETKWKSMSRKLRHKRPINDSKEQEDHRSLSLLQHREAALNRVKSEFDSSRLEIEWRLSPY